MSQTDLQTLISDALREPERFTARYSLKEPVVVWQARAVLEALKQKGGIA